MAGSTLDAIPSGSRVFLDATVFIYHFTGHSLECRRLFERCERGELGGVTCSAAVAEVTHRLMMIEAVSRGLVTAGHVVRKLRERPDDVRQLHVHQTQIDRIALMGVEVAPVDLDTMVRSAHFRCRYGLLTSDSIVAACADALSIRLLASADPDFAVIDGLALHCPGDLPAGDPSRISRRLTGRSATSRSARLKPCPTDEDRGPMAGQWELSGLSRVRACRLARHVPVIAGLLVAALPAGAGGCCS